MILYALRCDGGHEFEVWFRDAATFDRQAEAGIISCPICDSHAVSKAIMAPRLARHHGVRSGRDDDSGRSGDAGAQAEAAPPSPPAAGDPATEAMGSASAASPPDAAPALAPPPLAEAVQALRTFVEKTCEDVGDGFAEEARRIHYGEADARGIRGHATAEEAESLRDEGIGFSTLPWGRRTNA